MSLPKGTFRVTSNLVYDGPLGASDFCDLVYFTVNNGIPPPSILNGFFEMYSLGKDDFVFDDVNGTATHIPRVALVDASIHLPAFMEAIASGDSFDGDKSVYGHLFPTMIPEIMSRVTRPEFIQQVMTIITTSEDDATIFERYMNMTTGYLIDHDHGDVIEYLDMARM